MEASNAPTPPPEDRIRVFNQRFEVILAVLLGLAAIATAFAAYQTDLRDGDALDGFQEANRLADAASQKFTEAETFRIEDQQIFLEAESLRIAGDEESATEVLERLGSEELQKAYDAWDPETEDSPIESAAYENPSFAEGEDLDAQSEASLKEARADDKKGDRYTLVTVILAVALFLFGIGSVASSRRVKLGSTAIGTAILVASVAMLITA